MRLRWLTTIWMVWHASLLGCGPKVSKVEFDRKLGVIPASGGDIRVRIRAFDEAGVAIDPKESEFSYSIKDTTIAEIATDEKGIGQVTLRGRASGRTTLQVKAGDAKSEIDLVVLGVERAEVESNLKIVAGQFAVLQVRLFDRNGEIKLNEKEISTAITGTSSDPSLVALNNTSVIALQPGNATLTVQPMVCYLETAEANQTTKNCDYLVLPSGSGEVNNVTLSVKVESQSAEPANLSLAPANIGVAVGQTIALTATATEADGSTTDRFKVEFSSSDETVASIDTQGNVTGKRTGVATIAARVGSKTANTEIAVGDGVFTLPCPNGPASGLPLIPGWEGTCLKANRWSVIKAMSNEFKAPNSSSDTSNPLSALISPFGQERTEVQPAVRSELAANARARTYRKELICDLEAVESIGRVSIDCELDDIYIGSPPSVKRIQECEYLEGGSCGDCDSNSDCDGWLCGCSQSRCFFGRCTVCPGERSCPDPEFEVNVPHYKATVVVKGDLSWLQRARVAMEFKVPSAWRKVTTRRPTRDELERAAALDTEDMEQEGAQLINLPGSGKIVVEHDSDAVFAAMPTWIGLIDGDQVKAVVRGAPWAGTVTEGVDRPLRIQCTGERCSACAGPNCRPPAP